MLDQIGVSANFPSDFRSVDFALNAPDLFGATYFLGVGVDATSMLPWLDHAERMQAALQRMQLALRVVERERHGRAARGRYRTGDWCRDGQRRSTGLLRAPGAYLK